MTADLNSTHATTSTAGPHPGPATQPRTENTMTNTDTTADTTADVESALDGVCDAGRAAAGAVAGYLEGSHTFAVDEVDGVTVSHLHGWVVTGEVGSLTDPRAQWRSGPGLRTFIVTPALDKAGTPTHRIEQSLNRSHTDVVEDVTNSHRRAVAVTAAEPPAHRVARTLTEHPVSLGHTDHPDQTE